jgi:hypothetical protein
MKGSAFFLVAMVIYAPVGLLAYPIPYPKGLMAKSQTSAFDSISLDGNSKHKRARLAADDSQAISLSQHKRDTSSNQEISPGQYRKDVLRMSEHGSHTRTYFRRWTDEHLLEKREQREGERGECASCVRAWKWARSLLPNKSLERRSTCATCLGTRHDYVGNGGHFSGETISTKDPGKRELSGDGDSQTVKREQSTPEAGTEAIPGSNGQVLAREQDDGDIIWGRGQGGEIKDVVWIHSEAEDMERANKRSVTFEEQDEMQRANSCSWDCSGKM